MTKVYSVNKIVVLLLLTFSIITTEAQAAKRYVGDRLIITLRSGPGTENKVIRTLTSGMAMEITEEAENGYAFARLEDGMEGWVRVQYLSDKPIAKHRLEKLQVKYDKLKQQYAEAKGELNTLKSEHSKVSKGSSKLESQYKALRDRMARINQVAAKPILLDKENRELKEQNVTLTNEMSLVRQENQILKDRSDRDWFIAGAGVVLFGVILGLLLPKIRVRKKDGWSGGSL